MKNQKIKEEEKLISKDNEEPPDSEFLSRRTLLIKKPKASRKGSFFIENNKTKVKKIIFDSPQIEIVRTLKRCYDLWQEFSPHKTLFDTWEFRLAFYKGYRYRPYFILLKKKNKNLALLPLWQDEKKKYFWFGSNWQEENSFFAGNEEQIATLLSLAPSPLSLESIAETSVKDLEGKINFGQDHSKYVLDLTGFKTHEDYLMTLKKNRRRDLRKDRSRIQKQKPEITFDNFNDLDLLIDLCKNRFKTKGEDTDWEDFRRVKTFRQVIKLSGKSYSTRMITVKIKGKPAGVDLISLFNGTYYALKCGYNVKDFPGIGNFVNLAEIDDAIKLGMKRIDFLQNNYNWKSQYFEEIPLFKYEK